MRSKLLASFSGGETSAFMTKWILGNWRDRYQEIIVVFANTGEEREETLEFVDRCDREWKFNTVWIESVPNPEMGKGASAKVVDFGSASRNGEPFEAMIAKYGIPNQDYPHCSRELKGQAIRAYARSIGWQKRDYNTAIGIRIDEFDRAAKDAEKEGLIYPLIDEVPMTKQDINRFWANNGWRLNLKGYEGNCKWCWKKSLRKHMTIAAENPSAFDFPARMEAKYSYLRPESRDPAKSRPPYRFFRGDMTAAEILELSKTTFIPATDDHLDTVSRIQLELIFSNNPESIELDTQAGCSESCEAF